jgi:hypothetical protein
MTPDPDVLLDNKTRHAPKPRQTHLHGDPETANQNPRAANLHETHTGDGSVWFIIQRCQHLTLYLSSHLVSLGQLAKLYIHCMANLLITSVPTIRRCRGHCNHAVLKQGEGCQPRAAEANP